jgi:hypothetical protein
MRAYKLNNDATNPQSRASGGYVSFVAHIWVGENGKLMRGTIEDAHTGTRLALDLSEVVAFLQASLIHSPEQVGSPQTEGSEELPGDELGLI